MDLYMIPASSPCRAVLLAAKKLKVNLNLKTVNLFEGEQLKPEFLKINPQHKVPVLDDSGFYLSESRAIITYLANKYGNKYDEPLYPKDPKPRAIVDQRLYFDATTLYPAIADGLIRIALGGPSKLDPEAVKKIEEAFEVFETFLDNSEFAAGDFFTLADISLIATVSTAEACQFDINRYARVVAWYSKSKDLCPDYTEINENNLEFLKEAFAKNIQELSINQY